MPHPTAPHSDTRRRTGMLHRASPMAVAFVCLMLQVAQAEPRLAWPSESAPQWLSAVGKLTVSGHRREAGHNRHHRQDCSGTLVAATLVITAWHCLEFYTDLTDPIEFRLHARDSGTTTRSARVLATGGTMDADWALLQLANAVPAAVATPLALAPTDLENSELNLAGYSMDSGLGRNGEVLTWHPRCRRVASAGEHQRSDCLAYRGASGGAVVTVDAAGVARLVGVVSARNAQGESLYVPTASFARALRQYLSL